VRLDKAGIRNGTYEINAGNMGIDYSQFGMINRHSGNRVVNMTFADGHAYSWRPTDPTRANMNWGLSPEAQQTYMWY
jgi:prepilin-type processing-associated H-X9-DG protein